MTKLHKSIHNIIYSGIARTILRLNEQPKGGNCSINATSGQEYVDWFHLECYGWYDADTITNYKFYGKSTKKVLHY